MADFEFRARKTGDWAKAHELLSNLKRGQKEWEKAIAREAKHAANLVRQNLNSRGKLTGTNWPRLRPLTWKAKKTRKVLFESGRLYSAITAEKDGSSWFIGVASTEKPPGSNITLTGLAHVHEFGTTIIQRWTPKQRAAFFALLRKWGEVRRRRKVSKKAREAKAARLQEAKEAYKARGKRLPRGLGKKGRYKGQVVVIKIPARPFIFPVLERCYVQAQDEVELRLLKYLKTALKLK